MKLLSFVTHPFTAITYYRLSVPMETMADLDYIDKYVVDDFHPKVKDEDRIHAIEQSDLIHSHLLMMVSSFPDPRRVSKSAPLYDHIQGIVKYPASMILDVDDAYDNISPANPAYANWGVRGPEGNALGPGDKVIATMDNGRSEVLWADGEEFTVGDTTDVFEVKENYKNHARARWLMERCNAVTVTTPFLKDYYVKLHELPPKNVFVFPNCVRFDHYDKVELREHPGEIRILWQGGSSHFEDMKTIREPLVKVLKKYPHTKMIVFGQEFVWFNSAMPKEQFEFHQWVPYERHRLRMATLGHDINLCPLVNSVFNQGKSAIKWYESTAISRPAATLAANVLPYQEIEDGKTGMLYNTPEEFEEKLSTLIESETLRREIAGNAVDWIHENRDAMKVVPSLWEFYQQVRKEHIESFELMPAGV